MLPSRINVTFCHQTCFLATKSPKKEPKGKKGKLKVVLSEDELTQVISVDELTDQLNKVVDNLKADYVKHLNVRTSAGSLDSLPVNFENKQFMLNELAQLSRKNPQLIVINMAALPQ